MSLKERVENNIVLFTLGLLLAGFLAGVGVVQSLRDILGFSVGAEAGTLEFCDKEEFADRSGGKRVEEGALVEKVKALKRLVGTQVDPQIHKGFDFLLRRCTTDGWNIYCEIIINNTNVGYRELKVAPGPSGLVDEFGKPHSVSAFEQGGSTHPASDLTLSLNKGEPTEFTLVFHELGPGVRHVRYLDVGFHDRDDIFMLQWSDIEVR